MRPIDADALKEVFKRYHAAPHVKVKDNTLSYGLGMGIEGCTTLLNNAPTLDVEPVRRGKWIVEERPFSIWAGMRFIREDTRKTYTCDQCGIGIVGLDDMNYCPNCGAKMEVGRYA